MVHHFLHQLLTTASYCHKQSIIHQSLMSENIQIDHDLLSLKVHNFRFTRDLWSLTSLEGYTSQMALLPYKAPELLLSELNYGVAVDI